MQSLQLHPMEQISTRGAEIRRSQRECEGVRRQIYVGTRRYDKTIGCTALGLTLALLGSPLANADDDSFVRDTKALGIQYSSVNLISTGRSACYFLSRKRDPGQVTERVARYLTLDSELAHRFLVLSVNEYCPQYGGQVGA